MKNTLLIIIALVLATVSITLSVITFNENSSECNGKWLDYGGGLANLNQVVHIQPRIEDDVYGNIADSEVYYQQYKEGLEVSLESIIMLDKFKLILNKKTITTRKDLKKFIDKHKQDIRYLDNYIYSNDCYTMY